jgi:hypothetical protein
MADDLREAAYILSQRAVYGDRDGCYELAGRIGGYAKVLSRPSAPTTAEGETEALRRMLKTATVRLGILRDRMEGCDDGKGRPAHKLSLDEIPAWIDEQEGFLRAARGAGATP